MEILLLPIGLIVGGYIITRLSGTDVSAITQEWKAGLGILILVVPLLGCRGWALESLSPPSTQGGLAKGSTGGITT